MAQKVHDQTACRWHHERHGENGREAAVRRRVGSPHQGITTRCRHLAKRSLMPEGSDDGRVEKNVLYERTHEWKGSPLWSPWWLIAKGATDHFEVFTLDGGSILPVFSDEDEAEMYLWFERAREEGWEVRRCSSEELISVLYGPCSDAGKVVLDPSPEIIEGPSAWLVDLDRGRFLEWMISGRNLVS
jgi:hypothetical protein